MKKRIFLVFALLFFSLFIFDIVSAANLIVFNNSNAAQTPYFIVNGSTGSVGIGTASPGLTNGYAKLDLVGTASNAIGPHIKLTTSADAYPVFQTLGWTHDNIGINLDSYYDGTWRSADAGSNFQIYKVTDTLKLRYDSGIAAGSALTWEEGLALTSTGRIGIGTGTPSQTLDVRGAGNFSGTVYLNNNTDVLANLTALWNNINTGTNATATYVPYVGATKNTNLGVYNLTTTGRIGIRGSATQSTLFVNGTTESAVSTGGTAETKVYRDVASFAGNTAPYNAIVGDMVIGMPKNWSQTMLNIKIQGYDYSSRGSWEVVIGGYNYNSPSWINTNVYVSGRPPFAQVRLASNGTNNVIILGSTSTSWSYAQIVVTDVIAGFNSRDDWGVGWSIYNTTSESAFINIATPTIYNYVDQSGNFGIGTTTPSRTLDVRGDGNFSGDVYIRNSTSLISNLTVLNNFWNSNATIWSAINAKQTTANTTASYVPYVGASKNTILGGWNLSIGLGRTAPAATLDINGSLAVISYYPGAGSGTYFVSRNGYAIGYLESGGNITSSGYGSIALGAASIDATILASDTGSVAQGWSRTSSGDFETSVGLISATGPGSTAKGVAFGGNIRSLAYGSFAQGVALAGGYWDGFNTYIGSGELVSSGTGSFAQGYGIGSNSGLIGSIRSQTSGSFAQGFSNAGLTTANITAAGTGSFAQGQSDDSIIIARNNGSFAQGYAVGFGSLGGNIISSGPGSYAQGGAYHGNISASGMGSFAQGIVQSIGNSINSSGVGSFAQGGAAGGGNGRILSSGGGAFAQGYVSVGNIISTGQGSFAQGQVAFTSFSGIVSQGTGSFAQGQAENTANLTSSGTGSFAQGVASGGNITSSGTASYASGYAAGLRNIVSSNTGSFARGYTLTGNIVASGQGSVAIGDNITASGAFSYALGRNFSNAIADSFAVGFAPIPRLFVNGSAVGIGTTTPTRTLDVNGLVNASDYLINGTPISSLAGASSTYVNTVVSGNYSNGTAYTNAVNNSLWTFISANLTASYIDKTNATASYLPYNGAVKNTNLGNWNLTTTNGRVGIATTTPVANLHVNGSFAAVKYANAPVGTLTVGDNGFALGYLGSTGSIVSNSYGSLAVGSAGPSSSITASDQGAFAQGNAGFFVTGGSITASQQGAFAQGYALPGSIISSEKGAFAQGNTGTNGIIRASSAAAFAQGSSNEGTIGAQSSGAFARGRIYGGNITASGQGSYAGGDAQYGNITASGNGAFAGGYAYYANITASGVGSFVWGNNSQSTGNLGIVFGNGINNAWNNSFSVGFGNTGTTPTLFVNGTAVGIGTTTPRQTLDVRGEGNFSGDVYIRNSTSLISNLTVLNNFWNSNATIWSAINAKAVASSINTQIAQNFTNATAYTNNANNTLWAFISNNLSGSYVPYTGGLKNVIHGNYNVSIGLGRTTPAATLDINGSLAVISYVGLSSGATYNVAKNASALGAIGLGGNISALTAGSTVLGFAYSGGRLVAMGTGSLVSGRADNGVISATGTGATAVGYTYGGNISATGTGSFAGGDIPSNGNISASGTASFAFGEAYGANITASGLASTATGYAYSTGASITSEGIASLASGFAATGLALKSAGAGSVALGYANGAPIISSGGGSLALGGTYFGNITSTGQGSVALGYANEGDIVAGADGAFSWGDGVYNYGANSMALGAYVENTKADTFVVGFDRNFWPTIPIIFANGTNFGVRTSNPLYTLDVNGTVNAAGFLVNGSALLDSANATATYVPYTGATKNVVLANKNLSIGAGRTTALATLDINGTVAAVIKESTGTYNVGGKGYAFGLVRSNGILNSNGTASFASGYASVGTVASTGFGSFAQGAADTVSGVAVVMSTGSGSFAQGYGNSGKIISSGGGSFAQGTAINANMTSSSFGSFAGGAAYGGNIDSTGIGSFVFGNASSSSGKYGFVFGTGIANTISNSFSVGFGQIGSIPRLFVNGSAVGIGTTTPTATLDVNGLVNASGFLVNGTAISLTGGSDGTPVFYNVSGVISNNMTYGSTLNVSSNLFVNTTNVGVGTNNPQARLHVQGDVILNASAVGGNVVIQL